MSAYGFLSLRGAVRDGRRSDPRDVRDLKRSLGAAGYYRPLAGVPRAGST